MEMKRFEDVAPPTNLSSSWQDLHIGVWSKFMQPMSVSADFALRGNVRLQR